MAFRSAGAASWPAYTVPGGGLTFRANTDAGIVFVIGAVTNTSGATVTVTGARPMSAEFRPLSQVVLGNLWINPDGTATVQPAAGQQTFRTLYFTTVTPG